MTAGTISARASSPGAVVLSVTGITKHFGAIVALNDVCLDLRAGETHALVGENGSGKSTLGRIIAGAVAPDAGEVHFDGDLLSLRNPADALHRGIVTVTQELTLAPTLSVTENILMGRLPKHGPVVQWSAAHRMAQLTLDELEVTVDPQRRISELSIELRQEVELARALSTPAKVLILDEATSSLSEHATKRVLARVEVLRQAGTAILYVSHRMKEVYVCASCATVLRDGRKVGTVPLPSTAERELIELMVGRDIADLYHKREVARGDPILEIEMLSTTDGGVRDVTLKVSSGEIVGVAGLVGSGKTELGLALAGAIEATGEIRIDGTVASIQSPRDAIDAGIGFVPEDRRRSALLPTRSTSQNLSIAWTDEVVTRGVVRRERERSLVASTMNAFNIRASAAHERVLQLSGGNQQKVVLGRAFARRPRIVVLTEPTRGVDVGAKSEIYGLIQRMAETGAAVVMISSELPELLGLSDRIVVIRNGEVVADMDTEAATEKIIAEAAFGATDTDEEMQRR